MTIRTRCILNYVGIMLVILLALSIYLNDALKRMLDKRIIAELRTEANLVREFLSATLPETFDYDTVDALIDSLGAASDVRLTFIGLDGTVWGDTEQDGEQLRGMDNHRHRPEVSAATSSGSGIVDRYSHTVKSALRYFALPVFRHGERIGICRVALPMKEVDTAIARFRTILWAGCGIGLVAAILLSIVTAERITMPIRELIQTTKAIADGDITSRAPVSKLGELGQLSRHFNRMADWVEAQIDEISEERDRMDTILSKMIEGVLLIGRGFEITYANPAAIRMLELPKRYRGRPLIEMNRNPVLQRLLEHARDTGTIGQVEIRLPAERTEWDVEITVVPVVDSTDTPIGSYVIVLHDVSQLRKLERIRADFVANVSHELRTPLTSIQGYAETLLNGALADTSASQRFVGKIHQQSLQLSQLVSDLLDLSRLESGAVQLKLEPCQLNDFQQTIRDIFDPSFDDANLIFEWRVPENLPPVSADRHLLEQVFVNLIDNAIKYTPAGGRISVSAEASQSTVTVHVSDTGIGIPPDALGRIFERFYRVNKARSREMGGTGLGLSIAKHILLQHGGRIWAESTLGSGSIFHFVLPLQAKRNRVSP